METNVGMSIQVEEIKVNNDAVFLMKWF